jgi:hypothetical protein
MLTVFEWKLSLCHQKPMAQNLLVVFKTGSHIFAQVSLDCNLLIYASHCNWGDR